MVIGQNMITLITGVIITKRNPNIVQTFPHHISTKPFCCASKKNKNKK